ncbi:MAG: transporter substrate-binding domain-containing protein [Brevinematales bacterium]|nr:transporter substrate-binding domain-containing protein [Brevinematales bacterium]
MRRGVGFVLGIWLFVVSCQTGTLTEEEKAWIAAHPVIRLAPDPDFAPFEFFDQWGRYQGIGADMVREFSRWSGIRVEIYRYSNWSQVLHALSNREVDMINCAIDTPSRRVYATFPSPYLEIPNVVVTRKSMPVGVPFESILRLKTGMVRGYGMVDILRTNYPFFTPILYSTLGDGFRALTRGEIDYFLADLATASHYIVEGGFYTLRIDQTFEPNNISGFGVRSDWPILVGILEKFQRGFPSSRKYEIIRRWVVLGEKFLPRSFPFWVNWVIGIAFVGIVMGSVIVVGRVYRREKEYERRERELYQELSEMAEVLPVVLARLPLGTMMVEIDGTVSYVNSTFEEIFGRKKEEIKNFYTFYQTAPAQESDKKLLWEKWETIVTGNKPNPYVVLEHFLFRDAEGNHHPCRVDIHRLGKKFLVTFVDYSEQQSAEKEARYRQNQLLLTMKEKDLLFMELEHRVRNTLQLMRSFVRLHGGVVERYTSQELLVKLTCGVDLLTIVQNYTMQDLKLRLYDVKPPLLEFLRHFHDEIGREVESSVDSVEVNSQSLLALLFVVQEVLFHVWRCCKNEGRVKLTVRKNGVLFLRVEFSDALNLTDEDLAVSQDFVRELGGSMHYETTPFFVFEVRTDVSKLTTL